MSPEAATTTPRRTQEQRRAAAEARLVTAAAELISESGPGSVTLARVGERAGFSRGLAAHHFGSKAALMKRVADAVSDEFGRTLRANQSEGATLLDEILALVGVYFDIIVDPPVLNRARLVLIADAVAHTDSDTHGIVVAADQEFRRALAERIRRTRRTEGDDADADGLAVVLIGMLRGITFESMLDPDTDLASARREVERFVTARFADPTHPTEPQEPR